MDRGEQYYVLESNVSVLGCWLVGSCGGGVFVVVVLTMFSDWIWFGFDLFRFSQHTHNTNRERIWNLF